MHDEVGVLDANAVVVVDLTVTERHGKPAESEVVRSAADIATGTLAALRR